MEKIYKNIVCPKCGKSYFKEASYSDGNGNFFDFISGLSYNDCVYRPTPTKIYKDGVLQNPEAFVPSPTRTRFVCLECGCHFALKTTYHLNGAETHEIIDEDKEKEKREAEWKRKCEEREKEAAKKKAEEEKQKAEDYEKWKAEHTGEFLTINTNADTCAWTSLSQDVTKASIFYKDKDILEAFEDLEERIKKLEEKIK